MRIKLLLVVILLPSVLCMASVETCGKKIPEKKVQPDSTVFAALGQTISDVLFNPKTVTCYTLKNVRNVEYGEFQVEPHWVRDSLVGRLSPQMVGALQVALIANSENYKEDSIHVRAPYYPLLEFEFQKKKNVVHVLISTLDRTWTIMYEGERQIHFNYHDWEFINRFCNMFVKLDE